VTIRSVLRRLTTRVARSLSKTGTRRNAEQILTRFVRSRFWCRSASASESLLAHHAAAELS
jgi:hypothetical protein